MQKRIMWSILFLMLILLSGCGRKEPITTAAWAEMPPLTYGQLSHEKLDVLPWNSGRCETTSLSAMAETEAGFYFVFHRWLYYADKANPENWIVVCSDPTCTHYEECSAVISSGRFMISGDSVIYEASPGSIPVGKIKGNGYLLASKNLNGTFRKTEYVLEDMLTSGRSVTGSLLLPDRWLCQKYELTPEGQLSGQLYNVTQKGVQLIGTLDDFDILNTPPALVDVAYQFALNGDRYFTSGILDSTGKKIFGFSNDQLTEVDISGLTLRGSYISGKTLRFFRENEGYFDRDLESGEEVFLAPAQMENSYSTILLPNCILESTMLLPASTRTRSLGAENKLSFFDGEAWHDVELPEELKHAGKETFLTPLTVTSRSIVLCCMKPASPTSVYTAQMYQISLDAEQKDLEYWAEIAIPERPEEETEETKAEEEPVNPAK